MNKLASILLGLSLLNCASGATPPPQLTPVGDIAFYGKNLFVAISAVQDVAIAANKSGAISNDDTRMVVSAVLTSGESAKTLIAGLRAGTAGTTDRDKLLKVIKDVLENLPSQLSPHARELVQPSITLVLSLLAAFS